MPSDETISLLNEKGIIESDLNFEDYAFCDRSLTVSASYSDEEIVKSRNIESDASDEEDSQSCTRSTLLTR